MFGLVIPNFETLDESEKSRYQSIYCGLCHVLRDKYSNISRLALSYDLTFLSLLLNSLYEPKESSEYCNCIFHPGKKYSSTITEFSEYCADMTILLAYHKILDDINDEQKLRYKISEKALRNQYDKVKTAYPELCTNTENYMQAITEIENSNKHESDGDTAANIFGLIMAEIFAPKQDI